MLGRRMSLMLVGVGFAICGWAADAEFPDGKRQVASVRCGQTLTWTPPGDEAADGTLHTLVLRDVRTGRSSTRTFPRQVDATWSPDCRYVLLNNYSGSNETTPELWSVRAAVDRLGLE